MSGRGSAAVDAGRSDAPRRSFASDNYAGVHPEIMAALQRVNVGHQVAYGDDTVTAELGDLMRTHFGERAEVFPVFNGTGANVVALQAMSQPWEAVVCAQSAHVNVDEGGAPEKVAGLKLWQVPTPDGKLTPDLLDTQAWGYGDVHRAQPTILTITQSTEFGTLYSIEELAALVDRAKSHGMKVHLDGARIANAAAALGVPFRVPTRCHPAARRMARWGPKRGWCLIPRRSRGCLFCGSPPCSWPARCVSSVLSWWHSSPTNCGFATPATPTRWPRN